MTLNLEHYNKSKNYQILKAWLNFYESQIKILTSMWDGYWNKGIDPSIPIEKIEKELNDYYPKRDDCINRIDAKLAPGLIFEGILL